MSTTETKAKRRRGRGEGTIFQRADGYWTARISLGYDSTTGKRIQRAVHAPTKREVQDKLTDLQRQRLDGSLCDQHRLTVSEFWVHWLETVKRSTTPSTHEVYESIGRLHVLPILGGLRLEKLNPMHVHAMLGEMEAKGASKAAQKMAFAVLRRALHVAVKTGFVIRNCTDAVSKPRHKPAEIKPLTADQATAFLAATKGDRLHPLWTLALHTGMRQGELLGLQWEDVDFEAGTLSVRRSIATPHGKELVKETKTRSSRRQIELPAAAIDALWAQKSYQLKNGAAASPWVFTGMRGERLRRANMFRTFKLALKTAGLPPTVRFHDLRHTHATLLLLAGVSAKIVSARLGHSSVSITLDVYSHVLPGMGRDAADKINSLLAAPKVAATG